MDINDDLNHTNVIETVSLGAPEEGFRAAIRKSMAENMLGKTVEKAVIDSNGIEICAKGTPLTEDAIDRILNSDVDEVKVRNNDIRGVEVTAIVEDSGNGVIESLEDRIEGRTAAETLVNPETGEVIVALNEEIMADQAKEIAKYYDKVRIRSVSPAAAVMASARSAMAATSVRAARSMSANRSAPSLLSPSVNRAHS